MPTHTPGPYYIGGDLIYATTGSVAVEVATVHSRHRGRRDAPPPGEADANRRLFKAAPDLLTALKRVRAVLVEARQHACKEPVMVNQYATVLQCSGGAVLAADEAIAAAACPA